MKSTLSAPLGRTLYLSGPSAPYLQLLPLSMLQVHLATESRLSNLLTSWSFVHQPINTLRLMSSFSQLHSRTTLNCHCCSLTTQGLPPTMVFLRCSNDDQHRARRAATYHCKMSISHNKHGLGGLPIFCCRFPSPHTSLGLHKLLLVDQTLELNNCLSRNYLCPSRCCSPGSNLDTITLSSSRP